MSNTTKSSAITKEEILKENIRLKKELELIKEQDETIRHYLSVALDSGYQKKRYGYDDDVRYVYNWYEIFQEIGKLLEKKRYTKLEDNIDKLERKGLEDYKHIIKMLKHHFPDKFQDFKCNPEYLDYDR